LKQPPQPEPSTIKIITIGIDLAKSVFQIHGVDAGGLQSPCRKKLRRAEVLKFFEGHLPPCLVGMEACATAHFWAREIGAAWSRRAADAAELCKGLCPPTEE
jgi:transposase